MTVPQSETGIEVPNFCRLDSLRRNPGGVPDRQQGVCAVFSCLMGVGHDRGCRQSNKDTNLLDSGEQGRENFPKGGVGEFPYHEGRHLIAKLWVLADESGTHAKPSHCIVGGYIASPAQWDSFEKVWKLVLEKFGVPDFHSKDFFPRASNGERLSWYNGWTDKKADLFLMHLTSLIHVSELWPVGGIVDVAAFESRSFGEKKHYTGGLFDGRKWYSSGAPSKPYFLAMNLMYRTVFERTEPGTVVNFLFDEHADYEAHALEFFYSNKQFLHKQFSDKLGQIGFAPDHKLRGLQAADLLVYSWHHYLSRGADNMRSENIQALSDLTRKRESFPLANNEFFEVKLRELPLEHQEGLLATTKPVQPRRVKRLPPGLS